MTTNERAADPSAWTWSAPADLAARRIGVLTFDAPGRDVNVLTEPILLELETRLEEAAGKRLRGVVLRSGKESSFCAGADVDAIQAIASADDAAVKSALGQRVFRRLSTLGVPIVAAIHGACVGGGAEMACWCAGRVASTDDRTRIGFPEVRLGIVPGFGGTQVLPGIVGLATAIDLASSGRLLSTRQALRSGLVDAAVEREHLVAEAARLVDAWHLAGRRRPPGPTRWSSAPLARDVVAAVARRKVNAATGGSYPAPLEAVRLCRAALSRPLDRGLADEARTLGRLAITPVSRNLLHVYDVQRASERGGIAPLRGATLGVVGAGVMGAGIAGVAASRGYRVRVRDLDAAALARGRTTAHEVVERALRNSWRRQVSAQAARDRLSWTLELDGLHAAEVVVEAVVERADVKRAVLAEVESSAGPRTLVATNTSSLRLADLARGLADPARFVGLHFFNPVPRMPLVEVVRGADTSDDAVERARGWAKALGKQPVVVADSPGFLVNRILMPYLAEALALHQEGVAIDAVDRAARGFGMPMGPFQVLDEVGIDVAAHVARTFARAYPLRFGESPVLARLLDAGRLGRKAGGGFYERTRRGRPRPWTGLAKAVRVLEGAVLRDRLFLRMADEGLRCLEESIASGPRDVDLATVFGIGFPPWRGGLCKWIHDAGPALLHARMEDLQRQHGERFRPSRMFGALARAEHSLGYSTTAFRL